MSQAVHFVPDFFYQIFSYREFLKQSILRDLRNKYKRSVLGYLWTIFHPLAMMAVLAVVFSNIMKMPIKDYAVFLFCGLLPWNYFNSTAMMSLGTLRANARLFTYIPVPKYIFVLSITFSNFFNFLLALIPLLILMLFFGMPIRESIVFLPIVLVPFLFVTIGISLVLAVSSVYFDDTLHLAEVAMSALYFLCPVLYHRDLLPPSLVQYLVLNPLFCQIEFIRGVFYYGTLPDLNTFAVNFCVSLLILIGGLAIFRRAEDKLLYFV